MKAIYLFFYLLILAGCNTRYSVSINNHVLYDPISAAGQRNNPDASLLTCLYQSQENQKVETLEEISLLTCSNMEIRDINGLGQYRNLQQIDFSDNEIKDISALARLQKLRTLSMAGNDIRDIAVLISLPELQWASLIGNDNLPCQQLSELESRLGEDLMQPNNCLR